MTIQDIRARRARDARAVIERFDETMRSFGMPGYSTLRDHLGEVLNKHDALLVESAPMPSVRDEIAQRLHQHNCVPKSALQTIQHVIEENRS